MSPALPPDTTARTAARRTGSQPASRREADRAETAARCASDELHRVRGGEVTPREVGHLVARNARKAGTSSAAATAAVGRAARLLAGLGACAGTHPAAPALWAAGWEVLLTVSLADIPGTRVRTPRTPADAEVEVAGVVAHVQALAPAFVAFEVAGTTNRYVQAYADDAILRVESVSNRYLERSERLTRAESAAVADAGLHAPTEEAPNWYVDLASVPPAVAAGLVVRLLQVHDPGLRRGFRVRAVADDRADDEPAARLTAPPDEDVDPDAGTLVEGIAGPMLVVAAAEPEVEAHAHALAGLVQPWVGAVGWGGVVVVVDQAGCPFAAEIAPTGGDPVARLLPYVAAPPDIESALHDLGWSLAEESEPPWWLRRFPASADPMEVLELVVETLHGVCGLRLDRRVLLQVAPA